jgi:putative transposase
MKKARSGARRSASKRSGAPETVDECLARVPDPLYSAAFRRLLRGSGVKPLVLPAWSPNVNAFAERFVGSAKSECLERIVPLGEGHLRAAVRAFVQHYHEERPHQGLGNELIAPKTTSIGTGPVTCRTRLGGVLKFYYREAA